MNHIKIHEVNYSPNHYDSPYNEFNDSYNAYIIQRCESFMIPASFVKTINHYDDINLSNLYMNSELNFNEDLYPGNDSLFIVRP